MDPTTQLALKLATRYAKKGADSAAAKNTKELADWVVQHRAVVEAVLEHYDIRNSSIPCYCPLCTAVRKSKLRAGEELEKSG